MNTTHVFSVRPVANGRLFQHERRQYEVVVEYNGWPLRSLQWALHATGGPRALELVRDAERRAGWHLGLPSPNFLPIRGERWERRLPVVPLASGLIVNTLFYAALLWLLAFGPFTARQFVRNKRGRCIKCGRDRRGALSTVGLTEQRATGVRNPQPLLPRSGMNARPSSETERGRLGLFHVFQCRATDFGRIQHGPPSHVWS